MKAVWVGSVVGVGSLTVTHRWIAKWDGGDVRSRRIREARIHLTRRMGDISHTEKSASVFELLCFFLCFSPKRLRAGSLDRLRKLQKKGRYLGPLSVGAWEEASRDTRGGEKGEFENAERSAIIGFRFTLSTVTIDYQRDVLWQVSGFPTEIPMQHVTRTRADEADSTSSLVYLKDRFGL
jgi:hypothetical protein